MRAVRRRVKGEWNGEGRVLFGVDGGVEGCVCVCVERNGEIEDKEKNQREGWGAPLSHALNLLRDKIKEKIEVALMSWPGILLLRLQNALGFLLEIRSALLDCLDALVFKLFLTLA
ncbi:hypothetical protein COLO4_10066 [Corchorus olitorius]|uniref:Uncharacterized protein n=1 Tax=Corchorus olitorius TaxID=93759 RepID=A0A1R3KA21_9ROSI|nr:hypothetical protein COLO4_10066 [Corchorus olitorius]